MYVHIRTMYKCYGNHSAAPWYFIAVVRTSPPPNRTPPPPPPVRTAGTQCNRYIRVSRIYIHQSKKPFTYTLGAESNGEPYEAMLMLTFFPFFQFLVFCFFLGSFLIDWHRLGCTRDRHGPVRAALDKHPPLRPPLHTARDPRLDLARSRRSSALDIEGTSPERGDQ